MKIEEIQQNTAPCGLDCFNCIVSPARITEDVKMGLAAKLGIDPDKVECRGCRTEGGCRFHSGCQTLKCVAEKGVTFCFECSDFPCQMLQPAAKGAEMFPHNFKLYNLCRIQSAGLENWATNESEGIRARYFDGEFIPGTGPVLK